MSDEQGTNTRHFAPGGETDEVTTNIGEHEAPGASALTSESAAPAWGATTQEEENPYLGTPHVRQPIKPPAVIKSLGGAVPGEANPARGHGEEFDNAGPQDTASLLMEREEAEEHAGAPEGSHLSAGAMYQDQGYPLNATDNSEAVGGEHSSTDHVETEHLRQEADSYLAGDSQFDSSLTRFDSKEEQNARDVERASSMSGLAYAESNYERDEMHQPTQPSDLEIITNMRALPQLDDQQQRGRRGSDAEEQ